MSRSCAHSIRCAAYDGVSTAASGPQEAQREHQPLGVAGAEGQVTEADAVERRERRAGREGSGVVRRDDPLAGLHARGRVAARRRRDPVLEVARGQRDVARRAGRAAGGVDAHDLVLAARRGASRTASSGVVVARSSCFSVSGRRGRSASPPASAGRLDADRAELLPVEGGALQQVGDLLAVRGVVEGELLVPRPRLDGRVEHRHGSRSYVIASSAWAAMRKPTGCCLLLGEVREQAGGAREQRDGLDGRRWRSPRSSSTAAIGIETFMTSGRPHASATASRKARASATCGPRDAVGVGELQDALGPRVDRAVDGVAEARRLAAGGANGPRDLASGVRRRRALATRACASLEHPGALLGGAQDHRARSRGCRPRPRPAASPGRPRASCGRRRWSASSRARRSRRAAGRGRSAAPRSARARSGAGGSTR